MGKDEDYSVKLQLIDRQRLPAHIAVIMDGNGRWAAARNRPRSFGHRAGAEALRRCTEICRELGVASLSVYAFSTENWRRPADEVSFLMKLLIEYLRQEVRTMNEQDIALGFLGEREGLPDAVLAALDQALAATAQSRSMRLNLAINYGGRRELALAARRLAEQAVSGELNAADIDERALAAQLFDGGGEVDLLIRPSGEQRISNFLLYQAAYAELYFCPVLWPDFGKNDLLDAVIDYQRRERRFGNIGQV
ncbi:MAG: polyprenyl diphosphate synthase [Bacillota bacterium]|nr:polyprenyl diphosphate synthase [Bacillota bacterium]